MKKQKLEKGKAIHLTWLDSALKGSGWVYESDGGFDATPKEIESIGFIVDVTDQAVMIAGTRSPSGGIITPLSIPLGCITQYTILALR